LKKIGFEKESLFIREHQKKRRPILGPPIAIQAETIFVSSFFQNNQFLISTSKMKINFDHQKIK